AGVGRDRRRALPNSRAEGKGSGETGIGKEGSRGARPPHRAGEEGRRPGRHRAQAEGGPRAPQAQEGCTGQGRPEESGGEEDREEETGAEENSTAEEKEVANSFQLTAGFRRGGGRWATGAERVQTEGRAPIPAPVGPLSEG